MPVSYTKSGGQGHVYQVPDYPETADGPKAFKDFADFLDLILPPVGTIMPYVGSTAPTGWLLCQGQAVSSTTYPKLAAECGTKFGTAPAGQFRLPDLKGRVIAGLDSGQTEFDTIGKTGGAKSVTLTTSNMPAHTHSVPNHVHTGTVSGLTVSGLSASTAADHSHGTGTYAISGNGTHSHLVIVDNNQFVNTVTTTTNSNTSGGGSLVRVSDVNTTKSGGTGYTAAIVAGTDGNHTHSFSGTSASAGGHTHTISGTISGGTVSIDSSGATTTGSSGSGTAVNTMNPYITMNHIIRAA